MRDLQEFLDPTLKLPIRGKKYVVQAPDAKTGLWVQGVMAAAAQLRAGQEPEGLSDLVLDDDEEQDLMKRVLGDTFDEMAADKVPWPFVKHAGTTAIIWVVRGEAAAEEFWDADAAPKARKKKRKGSGSKGRPGSTGSRSPESDPKAEASPGGNSSDTGA